MDITTFLNLINPYLDVLGFCITIATFFVAFNVNKKIGTAFDRQNFRDSFQKLIGDLESYKDLIQLNKYDSIGSLQQQLKILTHRIQTEFPFFARETFKAASKVHDFNYKSLDTPTEKTALIELIDTLIIKLKKENR